MSQSKKISWNPLSTITKHHNLWQLKSELPDISQEINRQANRENQDFEDFDLTIAPLFDKIHLRNKDVFTACIKEILIYRNIDNYLELEQLNRTPQQDEVVNKKYLDYFLSKNPSLEQIKKIIPVFMEVGSLEHHSLLLSKYRSNVDESLDLLTYTSNANLPGLHYLCQSLQSTHPGEMTDLAVLHALTRVLPTIAPNYQSPLIPQFLTLFINLALKLENPDFFAKINFFDKPTSPLLKSINSNYGHTVNPKIFIENTQRVLCDVLSHQDYNLFKNNFILPESNFSLASNFHNSLRALTHSTQLEPQCFIEILNLITAAFHPQEVSQALSSALSSSIAKENFPIITLLINRNQTLDSIVNLYPTISPASATQIMSFVSLGPNDNGIVDYSNLVTLLPAPSLSHIVSIGTLKDEEKANILNFCLAQESLELYSAVKELNFFDIDYSSLLELIKSANNLQEEIDYKKLNKKNELNEIIMDFWQRENNSDFYIQAYNKKLLPLSDTLLNFLKVQKEKTSLINEIVLPPNQAIAPSASRPHKL